MQCSFLCQAIEVLSLCVLVMHKASMSFDTDPGLMLDQRYLCSANVLALCMLKCLIARKRAVFTNPDVLIHLFLP